ncbi:hypothetical protein, partial [Bacillus pumilus]|uniref:hypothetical protein n=1 Tax=Bacillus pumilus TaxID=1408 RepID=UPI001C92D996
RNPHSSTHSRPYHSLALSNIKHLLFLTNPPKPFLSTNSTLKNNLINNTFSIKLNHLTFY